MGREADVAVHRDESAVVSPPSTARLVIPDVLRGIAIVAMLIAHAHPFIPARPGALSFIISMFSEMASPLFALVMGISAQIIWNRRPRVGVTLLQQTLRGLFLIALGVWMATWGSWIAIILAYLGVMLLIGAPILLARTPVVIAVAAVLLLISQPLLATARTWTWIWTAPEPVRELMTWIFLGQQYRVVNLLPFFLLGALLLRHGFRRDALLWTLAVIAPVAYLLWGFAAFTDLVPKQSGNYTDTLRDVGLVLGVYVLVVLAGTASKAGARRFWDAVFVPLRACGQVALSLYVLHVALIGLWARANGLPVENTYLGWLVIVPGMILLGWAWWRFVGTGPVEWVMGWITGRRKSIPFSGRSRGAAAS